MTCLELYRTSFVGLVLLYYHLFEHVIFRDLPCVSDLDILWSYFVVSIADNGNANDLLL